MILYAFLLLILTFTGVSVSRWRTGLWLVILLGAIQDPVRKMVPGAPGYLALSTLPVWFGIFLGAARSGDLAWSKYQNLLPKSARLTAVFLLLLVPPAFISFTYAPGSWQITLLGILSYGTGLAAILAGMMFPRRDGDIEKLLLWFVVIHAGLLIGAPLERMGIGVEFGLLGTSKLDAFWVTYRTGNVIRMFSGFYRGPDVMGWHAAMVSMMAVVLALRVAGWRRVLMIALAAWGGVGVMLCARRKMISAVVVFMVLLILLLLRYGKIRRVATLGVTLVAGLVFSFWAYQAVGPDHGIEVFYGTIGDEVVDRVYSQGVGSVLGTIQQAGFWGYGLGMAVQGARYIKIERPNIWQESALDKLVAEIGVPGLVAFLILMLAFLVEGSRLLRRSGPMVGSETFFGLAALLLANAASAVVSAQIYGDPYIGTLLAFCVGLFFSASRLVPSLPTVPGAGVRNPSGKQESG